MRLRVLSRNVTAWPRSLAPDGNSDVIARDRIRPTGNALRAERGQRASRHSGSRWRTTPTTIAAAVCNVGDDMVIAIEQDAVLNAADSHTAVSLHG